MILRGFIFVFFDIMIKNREVIAAQNSPTKSQPFYNKPPLYMVPSNPQSVDSPASHLYAFFRVFLHHYARYCKATEFVSAIASFFN